MSSGFLLLLAVCTLSFWAGLAVTEPETQICVNYKFRCCPNVDYQVYSVTAEAIEDATCKILESQFNGFLVNKTQECKEAYARMYCVLAIPQCCDAKHPAIYQPCQSLCIQETQQCYSNYNTTITCPPGLWYDQPCNSGSGLPCP